MAKELLIPHLSSRLNRQFFARHADEVAKDLLGRVLVVERPEACTLYARLHEVAAYEGKVGSMSKGTMYAPGILAVSTKHGKRLLDVATLELCKPSCVTLIAADLYDQRGHREFVQGPGNLGKALEIGPEFDALPLDLPYVWFGGSPIDPAKVEQRQVKKASKNCQGYFYFK